MSVVRIRAGGSHLKLKKPLETRLMKVCIPPLYRVRENYLIIIFTGNYERKLSVWLMGCQGQDQQ